MICITIFTGYGYAAMLNSERDSCRIAILANYMLLGGRFRRYIGPAQGSSFMHYSFCAGSKGVQNSKDSGFSSNTASTTHSIGTISAAMLQSRFYKNFVCVLPQYFLGILAESASAPWSEPRCDHIDTIQDIHWTYIGHTLDIHYHAHPVVKILESPVENRLSSFVLQVLCFSLFLMCSGIKELDV